MLSKFKLFESEELENYEENYAENYAENYDNEDTSSLTSEDEMSYEEVAPIIKKSWKEIMKNEHEIGKKIFEFVLTKEISMSVLFLNSQIDQQSRLFMKMLDIVVGFLDDQHTMDEKLFDIGRIHNKQYGVKYEHYKHFRTAFMKAIKIFIPWNANRENAWFWFWDHMISVMSASSEKEDSANSGISSDKTTNFIYAIYESFDNAMESPAIFGNAIYYALLNEKCDIVNLFSKTDFEYQNIRFVGMLQHIIHQIDDQTMFQNKIISLSRQYRDYGITINQVELFCDIFIKILKTSNKDLWKDIHDEAWAWLRSIVIKSFQISLE